MAKHYNNPTVKRFVSKVNQYGDILETIDLDAKSKEEQEELLKAVFFGALERLGYENSCCKGGITDAKCCCIYQGVNGGSGGIFAGGANSSHKNICGKE